MTAKSASSVALQNAATLVLLRDGDQDLQVLMAKRSSRTRFSAGAFVFPGGGVDAADTEAIDYCFGLDAPTCDVHFGDQPALRYYLAAARELFEEVGIWLFAAPLPKNSEQLRKDLHAGRVSLAQMLAQLAQQHPHLNGALLDCQALHYFRFWTTPPGMPRRYRTRFFAALCPPSQQAVVDGIELTELCWTSPQAMLDRHQAGEVDLIFPTIRELEALASYSSATQAIQAMADVPTVPEIRTRHRIEGGRLVKVLMPGEPGYADLPAW